MDARGLVVDANLAQDFVALLVLLPLGLVSTDDVIVCGKSISIALTTFPSFVSDMTPLPSTMTLPTLETLLLRCRLSLLLLALLVPSLFVFMDKPPCSDEFVSRGKGKAPVPHSRAKNFIRRSSSVIILAAGATVLVVLVLLAVAVAAATTLVGAATEPLTVLLFLEAFG